MPWQQQVANVGLELDSDTGLPAYRSVVVTVPRQSGKTVVALGWEIQRALGWSGAQRIVYSAQTGNDARKKLIEDQVPILEPRKAKLGIRSILRGMGNEAVVWKNGSRLVLLASSTDSGHGKTVDLAIKDEYFADVDDRRDQALVPAMATRAAAQTLTLSTMGTDASMPLNRAVERGRAAVDGGQRSGVAYFEWSADPDSDMDDPATWWTCMPALGHTITEEVVRHARDTLSDGEFRRAFLNICMNADETVFPAGKWEAVCSATIAPQGQVWLGVDVNPEHTRGAIVAADAIGNVEVIDHGSGTNWLAPRLADLQARWNCPVAVDSTGPATSMIPELEAAGVAVHKVTDMSSACGAVYIGVIEGHVKVGNHAGLNAAVAGARRKLSGDRWRWARRDSTVDISPLVAMTLALWRPDVDPTPSFVSLADV